MKVTFKIIFVFVLISILLVTAAPIAIANSAEPPGLIVIVNFPPEDLTLSLEFQDGGNVQGVQLIKKQTAWEAQYRFFYHTVAEIRPSLENATLVATSGEDTFKYPIPSSVLSKYNNILSLDFEKKTVTNGQTFGRSAFLIAMRVMLTLLIEGFIFFIFKYRHRRSWIAFIIINLFTQGALNIALNNDFSGSYLIVALVIYEILIVIFELIALTMIINEHKKRRTALFVVVANVLSLFLGGVLISVLPV